ncbi:MAG: alpha/beta hydrolase [Gammaproteobacteria bacterium]|nr:alpha/beta hydrolase [Gammaproteobacteria bacterium]
MSYIDVVDKVDVPKPPKYYTPPGFETVMGVPVAYRREGAGEATVLLHGAGFTRMWIPFYAMMAEQVDFIAPESPGFGETPLPGWLRSFDDLTILYDQLFDQLGLERIHLVGFSMGGWAAAEFAAFYPRRLKSLTLITPVGLRLPDEPGVDIFQLAPAELMDRLFKDKDVMMQWLPDPENFDEGIHLYSEFSAAARLMWAPRYNLALERRLKRLACPALVVGAEEDRLVPNAMSDKYAEVLPAARLVRLAGTGHEPLLERPQELARLITDFVQEAAK